MAQKVHPTAFRLGTVKQADAKWFAGIRKKFPRFLQDDVQMRDYLLKRLREASVDRIEIERTNQKVNVIIHTAKPGVVIGRAGSGAEELKKEILNKFYRGRRVSLSISVQEVTKPSLSSAIVAGQIAAEIEKRMPFRRSMKQAVERVMKGGAQGVRVKVAGRLNGAEIARSESVSKGKIPLQTLRADIDYAQATARTVYGAIGIKVWIYRGEVFEEKKKDDKKE